MSLSATQQSLSDPTHAPSPQPSPAESLRLCQITTVSKAPPPTRQSSTVAGTAGFTTPAEAEKDPGGQAVQAEAPAGDVHITSIYIYIGKTRSK